MRESASQIAPLNGMAIAPPYRWMLGGAEFIMVAGPQGKPVNLAKGRRIIQPSGIAAPLGGMTGLAMNYSASPSTGYTTETGLTKQPTEITLCAVYRLTALNGLRGLVGHFYGSANGWSLFHQDATVLFTQVPTFVANPGITYPGGIGNTAHWYAIIGRTSVRYGAKLALRNLNTGAVVTGTGTHVALGAATSRQGTVGSDGPAEGDVSQGYFQMGGMWSRMWTDGQALEWLMDPYAFLRRKREPAPRYKAPSGGTLYTQSISGGITPAGTLARSTSRTLIASITAAGVLTKQEQRAVAATITPAGVLAKQEQRALSGSITPAGTESGSKINPKSLSAGITPSATIVRLVSRSLAAAITPSGALTRKLARSLAGAMTPAGTLAKQAAKTFAAVISTLYGYLGRDAFDRPNSATSAGTADFGGAWTVRQNAAAWGLINGKLYSLYASGASAIITQTYASTPSEVGYDLNTNAINTHVMTTTPLFVDTNNFLSINLINGAVVIATKVAGSSFTRVTVTQPTTGLPATGAASGSISVTIDPITKVVTVLLNGTPIPGATYTLISSEITAFGAALQAGFLNSYISGTATLSTADNWYALSSVRNVSITRLLARALAGSITPSATLARSLARSLAGSITPAAALLKRTARSLSAGITPSGALIKGLAYVRSIAGSITPAGSLSKSAGKVLAATIAPAATLTRRAARSLSASITAAATLARRLQRTLVAAITPSGTLSKSQLYARSFAATIAPVGSIPKRAGKLLVASVDIAGALASLFIGGTVAGGKRLLKLFRAVR